MRITVRRKDYPFGTILYVERGEGARQSYVMQDDGTFHFDSGPIASAVHICGYLKDAWPRYLAEKAKRSVTVSRETMRPMSDPEMQQAIQWTSPDSALFKTAAGLRICVIADLEGSTMPDGWWPLPDLSPMPAEFDGWDA